MSALLEKLLKNSTIKDTALISESIVYQNKDMVPTPIPMINTALSGEISGGLTSGVTMIAGPSRHFKTGFGLLLLASYLRHHKDAAILFYDTEFGTPQAYFDVFGIPLAQVVHTPITDIEQLKHDIMNQLDNITRKDKVIIMIDSIGNAASKKETDDAMDGKTVADMSRAKALKSLFRMITAKLTLKNIPLIAINHTYKELALYPKDIVSGGTGGVYGADNIWIIGRQQDKDASTKELNGYNFVIKVEKSRYVKEGSKIPIQISFDGGIVKWSGLLELAEEGGYIKAGKSGKSTVYYRVDKTTGEAISDSYKEADLNVNAAFWKKLIKETDFAEYIKNKYTLSHGAIISDDDNEKDDFEPLKLGE